MLLLHMYNTSIFHRSWSYRKYSQSSLTLVIHILRTRTWVGYIVFKPSLSLDQLQQQGFSWVFWELQPLGLLNWEKFTAYFNAWHRICIQFNL